ncbi:hypothetical protein E2K93_01620 [Thalassotalea sp. HSM 43]|uniref:hypothetical protein n=1 Tax=Thalassotalea sp. HSM 43 TaxID=2552945 RepID=UPI0010814118|nr:hypothetical protein [Thalassotalea sp. HSM 43]QBY03146.1 hypothetical protein E2K93_01620 [Thalassotalea sp. HSM 43]
MAFQSIPLNHQNQFSLWVNNNEALLFSEQERSLAALEPLNVSLFLAIDEGLSKQQIITQIVQDSGLNADVINDSYQSIADMFDNRNYQSNANGQSKTITYSDGRYPELDKPANTNVSDAIHIRVATSYFDIECDDIDLYRAINALFQPVMAKGEDKANFALTINSSEHEYRLLANGVLVEQVPSASHMLPVLIDRLQILAYQNTVYKLVFHGAALSRCIEGKTTTVLLPGVSGAGKTTLAAELSSKGFYLHSDEIIAFDQDFNIPTIDLPMAIKSGSWPHLHSQYTELAQAQEWLRIDGRRIKYVWPAQFANKEFASKKLRKTDSEHHRIYILCPEFTPKAAGRVEQLTLSQSLALMTHGGYQLGHELSRESAAELIYFFENLSSFKLTYGTSSDALQLVEDLCQR